MTAPDTQDESAQGTNSAETGTNGAEGGTIATETGSESTENGTTGAEPTDAEGDKEGASNEPGEPKASEPAPVAVAKPAGPPAPEGHALVDVPTDVAAKLPETTTVSMSPDKELVATVAKDGRIHTIIAAAGAEFRHLVAEVEHYFGETFGG